MALPGKPGLATSPWQAWWGARWRHLVSNCLYIAAHQGEPSLATGFTWWWGGFPPHQRALPGDALCAGWCNTWPKPQKQGQAIHSPSVLWALASKSDTWAGQARTEPRSDPACMKFNCRKLVYPPSFPNIAMAGVVGCLVAPSGEQLSVHCSTPGGAFTCNWLHLVAGGFPPHQRALPGDALRAGWCNTWPKNNIAVIFYIRVIQPTLELPQLTRWCLWYLQISNTAHGMTPLSVGKSVNIRVILRFTWKVPTQIGSP